MWLLLAQAAAPASEGFPNMVGTGLGASATAILGWFCWYMVTKTIPNMNSTHQQAVEKLTNDFREEMAVGRESCAAEKMAHLQAFRDELKEERMHRTDGEKCMAAAVTKMADAIAATKG